jgi:histone H3/H4
VESGEVDEDADAENADRDANEPDVALPLARVKRIMKLDKEVKNCANDACRTITRATELFVESLVEGAFASMRAQKRKTIKHGDVEHHVLRKPRLEFLGDHVWASRPRGAETQAAASLRAGGASEADKENKESADGTAGPEETVTPPRSAPEAPAGARQVTDFFRAERRAGADGDENDAGPAGAGEDAATE